MFLLEAAAYPIPHLIRPCQAVLLPHAYGPPRLARAPRESSSLSLLRDPTFPFAWATLVWDSGGAHVTPSGAEMFTGHYTLSKAASPWFTQLSYPHLVSARVDRSYMLH
jgi:hypothetical protein